MVINRQMSLKKYFSNYFSVWFYCFSEVENVIKLLDLQIMGLYGVGLQDKEDQTAQKEDLKRTLLGNENSDFKFYVN